MLIKRYSIFSFNFRLFLLHIFIWLLFLAFPFSDFFAGYTDLKSFIPRILLPISLFYINYFFLVPKLLLKNRLVLYIVTTLILIFACSITIFKIEVMYFSRVMPLTRTFQTIPPSQITPRGAMISIHKEKADTVSVPSQPARLSIPRAVRGVRAAPALPFDNNYIFMIHMMLPNIILFTLYLTVSSMFKIFIEWNASYKRQKEAEMEKKNSELNFLKAQLNPHFFFNSLNTIFSLSIKKSEQTPVAILNLSELMRYMLYETNKDTVPLEEEILYIKNYIELQKLRLTENVNIIFEVDCDETSIFIPPLLFISFIENAFKHGIDPSKENEIIVKFKVQKNEIDFSVINDINRIKSNGDSFGLGIENTVKRINLYFPERNELETYADSGKFYVKLKLKLNED